MRKQELLLGSNHREHIEAFKEGGAPRNVLSVDGRFLVDKLKKATESRRS